MQFIPFESCNLDNKSPIYVYSNYSDIPINFINNQVRESVLEIRKKSLVISTSSKEIHEAIHLLQILSKESSISAVIRNDYNIEIRVPKICIKQGYRDIVLSSLYICMVNNNQTSIIFLMSLNLEYETDSDNFSYSEYIDTITLTFGDQAENHVGMQKIGHLAENGFDIEDLNKMYLYFKNLECDTELISLNNYLPHKVRDEIYIEEAYILIIRNGINSISNANDLYAEQKTLEVDTKAFMYGRVVNKKARHNLCFSNESQEPNYELGKGRIIAYEEVPLLSNVRNKLIDILGQTPEDLCIEGNYYYDSRKCGIGFHGDTERRKVIAIRLGASIPLHYQWFLSGEAIGRRIKMILNHGDIYIMSEKATGHDWRKRSIYTLRHAAGADKYLTIKL